MSRYITVPSKYLYHGSSVSNLILLVCLYQSRNNINLVVMRMIIQIACVLLVLLSAHCSSALHDDIDWSKFKVFAVNLISILKKFMYTYSSVN